MTSIGLVGAGNWGFNWARTLAKLPEVEFRWCCDLNQNSLNKIAQQFITTTTTSYHDLLNDPTLDGIVLASSAPTHYPLAKQALEAGKHLLVEKPITLSASDARDLVHLANEAGKILMVGHLMEYHPAIKYIQEMIRKGELGEIQYLYSQRLNLGTVRQDENAWWSLAPHDISIACRLFGQSPTTVQCRGQGVIQHSVHDVIFATLSFGAGSLAHVHVSWLDPHRTRKLTVVGSKQMVSFDDTSPNYKVTVYDKNITRTPHLESYADWIHMHQGNVVQPHIPGTEPLVEEARHFVHCMETGERPISDGWSGLQVVSVLEAGEKSLQEDGTKVILPPPDHRLTLTRAAG